jgi:uncharacterized protein YcbX
VIHVDLISVTPVKCMALHHPDSIDLTAGGVLENRRFLLVDGEDRRLRSSLTSWPMPIRPEYDPDLERLTLRFPDGTVVEGSAHGSGEAVEIDLHGGRSTTAQLVAGGWNDLLSEMADHPVRLMRPVTHGRLQEAPVTLLSDGSLERLSEQAGAFVDGRRFRMLLTLSGCRPHEEDDWNGRLLRIGGAVVRAGGPVDRCAMTTRDPDTGARDIDTLRLIKDYRGTSPRGTIDFGVYGDIVRPGTVRVGDRVEIAD